MQQASNPTGNPSPNNGKYLPPHAAPAAGSPRFVINLCASTTPVGLVQPSHAGLKRFTFFVSRRLEEGRERFRLHMGYFESQEEAEKILDLVRDVYPAAWAGVAPGIRLRSRTNGAAAAPTRVAAAVPMTGQPPAAVEAAAAALAPAALLPPIDVPTLAAAFPERSAARVDMPSLPPVPAAAPAAAADNGAAAQSFDNIRATIDSLGDDASAGAQTAAQSAAADPAAQTLDPPQVLRLLETATPPAARAAAPAASPSAAPSAPPPPQAPAAMAARPVVQQATPVRPAPAAAATPVPADATLRKAAAAPRITPVSAPVNEPAVYAVQLLWSVQPIDMNQVPQLAIFSAYTLYGAEGNRDGRRWYGLRLGFFTDAVSAKQVAQYVRSEFTSVSVVPVTHRERDRAGTATAKPLPPVTTAKSNGIELNFIEDVQTDTATSGSRPALQQADTAGTDTSTAPHGGTAAPPADAKARAAAAVGMSARATPGKRAKLRVAQAAKPVSKRPSVEGRPLSLEETLEVLGAGQLQIDDGRTALLSDAATRVRKPAAPSGSRFGRLINRLAERLGNG